MLLTGRKEMGQSCCQEPQAPAIRPRLAGLAAARAGFLCSLCEPFLPAIDIGFPARCHFQGCKSAGLLYLVFVFSLRSFQTCWRSRLLWAAMSPVLAAGAVLSPPGIPRAVGTVCRSLPTGRPAKKGQDMAKGGVLGGTPWYPCA